MGLYRN